MASYSEDLAQGLRRLVLDDKFTDFTICAGGREFKCHRVILAAMSEYFEAMFDGGFVEMGAGRVCLDDMGLDEQTCADLLEYLYTGNNILTMETAHVFLHVAHMAQIKSLHRTCKSFLLEHANKSTCVQIWQIAKHHDGDAADLAEVSRSLILKHFAEIAQSEDKLDELFEVEDLIQIIRSDIINAVDKSRLFCEVAFSWIVADIENRSRSFRRLCHALENIGIPPNEIIERSNCVTDLESNQDTKAVLEELRGRCHMANDQKTRFVSPADDVLVVIGGNEGGNNCSVMAFSFPQKTWFSLKPLTLDPGFNFAICSRDLDLFISGGSGPGPTQIWHQANGGKKKFLHFRGEDNEWNELPDLPEQRQYHMMYAFGHYVYVFGGRGDNTSTCTNIVFKFDYRQQKWIECKTKLYRAVRSAAHACVGKRVYFIGGFGSDNNPMKLIQSFDCEFDQSSMINYSIPDNSPLNSRAVNYNGELLLVCKNGTILKCSEKAPTKQVARIQNFERKVFGLCCFENKLLICGGEVDFNPQKDMLLYDITNNLLVPMQETMPISVSNFCFTKTRVLREYLITPCATTMAGM